MSDEKTVEEFNVQAILQKIDRCLALGDEDGAIREISRPWPGMDEDLRVAVGELIAELERTGKAPLFMKDIQFDDDEQSVSVQFPDWFIAANQAFDQRYSNPDEAGLRFQKTMAVLHRQLMWVHNQPGSGIEELREALAEWLPAGWPSQYSRRLH
jgi:hypothetical protein